MTPIDAMLYGVFKSVAWLPLGVLYGVADVLGVVMHRLVGYRQKVVRANLASAFPEKNRRELREIERKFYRWLAGSFVEAVKLASMSEREMCRRMVFENIEEVNADLRAGRNVALYLGHYGNWEWVSSMPLHLTPEAHPCQIYHRLHSSSANDLYLRLRSRFGATCVAMDEALLSLRNDMREGRPNITGYISDQAPKIEAIHHFIRFLNHDTPVITGTERLARMSHAAVYYLDVDSPRRGHYTARFVKMAGDASALPTFVLTDDYWLRLEATIRRRPEMWLWSHKRWKHTAEQLKDRFPADWQERLKRL